MITNWPRKINKSLLMPTMIIHHGIGVMVLRPPNEILDNRHICTPSLNFQRKPAHSVQL